MKLTIKQRLILNIVMSFVLIGGLLGNTLYGLSTLRQLQDEGAQRADDAVLMEDAANIGARMYQVVADGVINRNLDETRKDWAAIKKENLEKLAHVAEIVDTPEEKQWLADSQAKIQTFIDLFENKELAILAEPHPDEAAIRDIDAQMDGIIAKMQEAMKKISASVKKEAKDGDALFDKTGKVTSEISLVLGLVILVVQIGISIWILRSISTPLDQMRTTIAEVEHSGDFTRRVPVNGDDEVGQTAKSFNDLMSTMQAALRNILNSVDEVSDATRTLSSSSAQVATSSVQQSESASAMAATVEEVTASISHVSDSAREALEISRRSGELSSHGGTIVHNAAAEMMQIADTVRGTSSAIEELGQQSNQISSVVQVIKDVADQTNLLALNAAIEAARAGEQGRGFAVVADEVRKLAERTTKATEEITQMINTIQHSARAAVSSMDNAVNQVSGGVALAQQAEESINQIKDGSGQVIGVVNDISSALMQQSSASNDISSQVEKVAQMSEENSAAAGETAGAANHLEQLANDMRATVSKFRI